MKTFVFLVMLLPFFAGSQSIVLLDRNFKDPISLTEGVQKGQLLGRWFPLYAADFDTVIQVVEELARTLDNGMLPTENLQVLAAGHSSIAKIKQGSASHPTYNISITTRCGNVGAAVDIVKGGQNKRKTVQELHLFLDYIKNNRHLVK